MSLDKFIVLHGNIRYILEAYYDAREISSKMFVKYPQDALAGFCT